MSISIGELAAEGVVTFSDGYRTKRPEHGRPGFRILRVADVANGFVSPTSDDFVAEAREAQIGTKLSQPGDVLLTTKGTVGRVAIMPLLDERVVYSPQLCYFRVHDAERLNARWLSYWFKSDDFLHQASHRANNTDMAAYINLADIRSLQLPDTAIEEQRGIAEVLGALDDKIAANAALIASAESVMTTQASLATATTEVGSIASHSTATVRPEFFNQEVAHYSLPAFDVGIRPDIAVGASIKSSKFVITTPSVLISKLNPRIPRIWNVPTLPRGMALSSTEFVVLQPTGIDTSALWAAISDPEVSVTLTSKVAGTSGSHQRVKPAEILRLVIRDPRSLPDRVRNSITTLGLIAHTRHEESGQLADVRDALLPQLMSGKIRVKDAERVVEGVV